MKVKKIFNNVIVRMAIAGTVLFIVGFLGSIVSNADEITHDFVRFHIIGNSNSMEDQQVKMKVREKIFETFDTAGITSKEAALTYFRANREKINQVANLVLYENDFTYTANVSVGKRTFPIREYNNFTLPSGNYDAVTIALGEAKGENFFCVMYPGLCMIDGISEKTEQNIEILNNTLTDRAFHTITGDKVVLKFKIAEIFSKMVKK